MVLRASDDYSFDFIDEENVKDIMEGQLFGKYGSDDGIDLDALQILILVSGSIQLFVNHRPGKGKLTGR